VAVLRFDSFSFDTDAQELRKDGRPLKLQPQPGALLGLLLSHAGAIVTREDIQKVLWPDGTVVDYDQSINFCVKRIREALGDDPATPRYLETVPRRGYRFLADLRPVVDSRPARRVRAWTLILAIGIAGAVLLYLGSRRGPAPSPARPVHLSVALEPGQRLSTSNPLAISPDGSTIVVHTAGRLHVRRIDEHELRPIPGTEDAQNPFFSPDGERIGFLQKGFVRTRSLAGGASTSLGPVENYIHGRWGDRGTIFFSVSTNGPIFAISEQGGAPERVTAPDPERGEAGHGWPEPLPGERALLYSIFREAAPPQIALKDLESESVRILVEDGFHPLALSTGHIVFSRENSLFAVPFDGDRLEVRGRPEPVLPGVFSNRFDGHSAYDLSRNGTLLYEPFTSSTLPTTELVWVDRTGRAELVTNERGTMSFPRLSPDERRLLLTVATTPASYGDLHVVDLTTKSLSRFRSDGDSYCGNWSPDGRQIVFTSSRTSGRQNLYLASADGSGEVERLTDWPIWEVVNSWSRSGPMAFVRSDTATRRDIYLLSLDESREPVPLVTSPFFERAPALSPDGRFLGYESDESGKPEIYVARLPAMAERKRISLAGGITPLWSKDGRELFYVENDRMMVVDVTVEPSFTHSAPRVLFQGHYVPGVNTGAHWANYDVTNDGKRFVMVRLAEATTTARFDVILNWHQTLDRIGDGR
jgi:DNA-binding winged helix-turn-helix (wHTH) protein